MTVHSLSPPLPWSHIHLIHSLPEVTNDFGPVMLLICMPQNGRIDLGLHLLPEILKCLCLCSLQQSYCPAGLMLH